MSANRLPFLNADTLKPVDISRGHLHRSKSSPPKRHGYVRGVNLTPRLFGALAHSPDTFEALPGSYITVAYQYVHAVAPSKQTMATYWCPIVVEDEAGFQHVLHVDPIAVRQFRRKMTEEIQDIGEKRGRMLRRIKQIRQEFPEVHSSDVITRLKREIGDAKSHENDPLVAPLPSGTGALHVVVETGPHSQLALVRQCLLEELPKEVADAHISFTFLDGGKVPSLAPDPLTENMLQTVSERLHEATRRPSKDGYRLAKALRWATMADALTEGTSTVLLVVCSAPTDLDACMDVMRRSEVTLQIVGVFGSCPEDPEAALQQLADASAPGSVLRLYFGRDYWQRFVASRSRQLQKAECLAAQQREREPVRRPEGDDPTEIVSAKVFELRLIERIMRECYAEEQQCEEEIVCAGRVLDRSLVDREAIIQVLSDKASLVLPGPKTR